VTYVCDVVTELQQNSLVRVFSEEVGVFSHLREFLVGTVCLPALRWDLGVPLGGAFSGHVGRLFQLPARLVLLLLFRVIFRLRKS